MLRELGYRVDASVVPHTDFSHAGRPDFTGFPSSPFAPCDGLMELPLSVHFAGASPRPADRFIRVCGAVRPRASARPALPQDWVCSRDYACRLRA